MYTPKETVVVTKRLEFEVKPYPGYPVTIRDLQDSISQVYARLQAVKGEPATHYDDAILIKPTDDGLILYFEVDATEQKDAPPARNAFEPSGGEDGFLQPFKQS